MNAPRLCFPDLPPLRWRDGRCVSTTAEICAAMAHLRPEAIARGAHSPAGQLRTRLWMECQRRLTEERVNR